MFQQLSDIVVGASALGDVRHRVDGLADVQSAIECVLVPVVQEAGHSIVEGIDVVSCDAQQLLVVGLVGYNVNPVIVL